MKKIHFDLDKMNAGLNFVPTNLEFNPAIHFGQFWTKMVNQIKIGINKNHSSLIKEKCSICYFSKMLFENEG